MVAVVVVAIILTLAVPAFSNLLDSVRLQRAIESIYSDLNLARSQAVKRNRPVMVNMQSSGGRWCYGLKEIDPASPSWDCDCDDTPANCTLDVDGGVSRVHVVRNGLPTGSEMSFPGVTLAENVSFQFEPVKGLPRQTPADGGGIYNDTFLINSGSKAKELIISIIGRIRIQTHTPES